MRTVTVCLLGLAVALGGPAVADAKKAKKKTACQKLSKRYKDVATSSKLVAVVRGNDETGDVSACVLPRGKVRTLAEWDDGLGRDWGGIHDTAGTWVLYYEGHGDQYGGTSRSLTRVNVRDGTTLSLSGYGCQLGFGYETTCPDGTNYDEADIAPNGSGAVERTDFATGETTLDAFTAAGAVTTLADGAVDALLVTSKQISWSQAGAGHAVALPQ